MTVLAQNVKRWMTIKDKTVQDIVKTGFSRTELYRIRYKSHVPNAGTLARLAKAIGVDSATLLKGAIENFEKKDKLLREKMALEVLKSPQEDALVAFSKTLCLISAFTLAAILFFSI